MPAEVAPTPYDLVPYPSGAYRQTHPDRLEVLARVFGMNPPDARRSRVLELGCADGANLIPVACALPESHFVGIDLSARQLQAGHEVIAALGLTNIELHHLDIRDVDAGLGAYDYIIAHGVFSWVPREAQEHMFEVCRERLRENGVAYISYNTNPGWRLRGMLRDMMLYHASKFDDAQQQIEQARALIQWLSEIVRAEDSPYGVLLRSELEQMRGWQDRYFRHDSLAEFNEPVYFHQFVERAEQHGLQYLAESEFPSMLANNYPPAIRETLNRLGRDIIELEQYMDFVRNRLFRQTLLCHRTNRLNRSLGPWTLRDLLVAASLQAANPGLDLNSTEVEVFRGGNDLTLSTKEPIVKAALGYLREQWPLPIPFADLFARARSLREAGLPADALRISDAKADEEALGGTLLTCFTKGLCELHARPAEFAIVAGERPLACPYARLQATRGDFVTNRRHERVTLDKLGRHLIPLLDGTHDRGMLTEALIGLAEKGTLKVTLNDEPVREEPVLRKIMASELEGRLSQFGRNALLVGEPTSFPDRRGDPAPS